jgi:LacI family transcriptional regulator
MDVGHTKIALILNKDLVRCRGILRGILQHSHECPNWILHTAASLSSSRVELLRQWAPDGIIAEVLTQEDEQALTQFKVPTVAVSMVVAASRFPHVVAHHRSIGEAVAQHLLDRQVRNFGYVGPAGREDVRLQQAGFARAVQRAGAYLHPLSPTPGSDWASMDRRMSEWLLALPRPFGLMLWDDDWGLWITQLCRLARIRVPDEASLVGVNDDRLNCELSDPALSSVGIPLQQIGQTAARVLGTMLSGRRPPRRLTLIPHLGVTARPSSDILTIPDPDLAAALRYIRGNAHTRIGVRDILSAVPVSRRILERKFREHLDTTPLQFIRKTQVDMAMNLLARTDAPLKDIAARIGFDNVYHLCRMFKRHTATTPMQYRRQFRA